MNDTECIKLLLSKNAELHNRFNSAIEEIMRKGNGKESVNNLIESIKYVAEDMERIINR